MKATLAYDAKKALFDELKAQSATGMALEGVQVSYSYPGRDAGRVLVYGGGVRFAHEDLAEEMNSVGYETITVGVYVRALRPGETVAQADDEVEAVANSIVKVFSDKPQIAGNMTWIGIASGNADYSETPDGPESVLSLQVSVGAIMI